jgi:hypothetical protein
MVQPIAPAQRRVGVIRGRNTPRAVLRRSRKTFVARTKGGKVGVFRRTTKKRGPIDLSFALETEARLESRLKFEATVGSVVASQWDQEFGAALARALASSRS